jgi:hypothetical protein
MLLVRSRVVFFLLLFLLPLTSHAATITFYDMRSDWETAVGGVFEEEDFNDGLVNAPGLSVASTVGTTSLGVWTDQVNDAPLQTTEWFFAIPVRGFGALFDLAPIGPGQGIAMTISLAGGTQLLLQEVPNSSTGEFFGFVSSEAFTSVSFTEGTQPSGVQETFNMDELVYSPIPESTSVLMVGTGLIALAGLLARRRRMHLRSDH